jgi:DNA-binding transcriptional LysR family regulator
MSIELRHLHYFIAVAEERHFGRAAQKLHMTQPPLSQAIQSLENKLGTALFLRTTRSISLTAAGQALLPEAKRLIGQAELLPGLAQRAAAGELGQLVLSFVSIADYGILPPTLRQFSQKHAAVKIELREATSDVQFALLEKSEVDAGLVIPPIPDHLRDILAYRHIRTEPLILAIPETVSKRKAAGSLATYKDLPLILFPRKIAPALHDSILGCFSDTGLAPEIAQEAIQMQTIIALVSANMGIALVPQSVSNLKRPGVVYQKLNQANLGVEIGIAWRRDNHSPVLQAFLNLIET